MKKRMLAVASVMLAAVLTLSGCTIGKLADSIKERLESGASEMASELSSAADDISKDISEAVSDAGEDLESLSEEVSDKTGKTEEEDTSGGTESEENSESESEPDSESEEESDTEKESDTEDESASEKEDKTDDKTEEKELPVPLHLLHYVTSRYIGDTSSGTYRSILGMKMDDISLMRDEQLSLYPDLLDVLERRKLENWKTFEQISDDMLQNGTAADGNSSSYESVLKLGRCDSGVLSYAVMNEYYYAGAARPWRETLSVSLDPKSGKELKLSDFTADTDGLIAALREAVADYITEEFDYEDAANEVDYFFEDIEPDMMPFTLGYDRISFWFNAGDILPYAFPGFSVDVYFKGNEKLFTDRALDAAEDYIISIPGATEVYYQYSEDQKLSIEPNWQNEEKHWLDSLKVTLGDKSTTVDISGDGIGGAYLMHSKANGSILYVEVDDYNGYGSTAVIDLNGSEPVYVGKAPERMGGPEDYESNEEDHTRYETTGYMTDSREFYMCTPVHILSSYYAFRKYGMGEGGMPEALSGWYDVEVSRTLTLLKDLEVKEVDPETDEETGTRTLVPGDQISIYRVDIEGNRVEFYTMDGAVIMIELESNSGSWSEINGIRADELFDGMMFAG